MKTSSFAGLAALVLSAGAAFGQAAPTADSGSSKQVGDWTVNCTTAASPNPCEMAQGVADKASGSRLLNLSLVYIPANDQTMMVVVVPLGVSIQGGLVLKSDNFTSPKLPYHHCDRNGCIAEIAIDRPHLQQIGTSQNASITMVADNGKNYALKLSMKGFADADNAMMDLAKQKAKNPPPAAPSVIPAQ